MKKTRYTFTSFLFAAILAFAFSACEKEDRTYGGPVYYEFSPDLFGQSVSGSNNLIQKETSRLGNDTICVQMIRKNTSETKVRFRIADKLYFIKSDSRFVTEVPAGLNQSGYTVHETSAIYGTDFDFKDKEKVSYDPSTGSGTITLAAGELFAYLPMNILERNNTVTYFVLEDSENAQANVPTSLLSLTITSVKTVYFEESFATEIPTTWGNIDKDGDGHAWVYTKTDGGFAMSRSYESEIGAMNPENYLVSPAITVPASAQSITLSYDLSASAKNAYQEQYRIVISEAPITEANCREAKVLKDWTELTQAHRYWTVVTTTTDIQEYAGKTFYVAFVHGNCTDMDRFLLKNVTVYAY